MLMMPSGETVKQEHPVKDTEMYSWFFIIICFDRILMDF